MTMLCHIIWESRVYRIPGSETLCPRSSRGLGFPCSVILRGQKKKLPGCSRTDEGPHSCKVQGNQRLYKQHPGHHWILGHIRIEHFSVWVPLKKYTLSPEWEVGFLLATGLSSHFGSLSWVFYNSVLCSRSFLSILRTASEPEAHEVTKIRDYMNTLDEVMCK